MSVSKPRTPSPGSAGNQLGILDLYQQCLAKQQNSMKQDLGKLKLILAKEFLFGRPLFVSPPVVDESSAINKQTDLKIRTQLWEAGKYRGILEALRAQTKQEDRLLLLAWWLNQENVCEPEDIVGSRILRQLAKKLFGFLSTKDFHHAEAVRAWIPYFDKLIRDSRVIKDNSKLVGQGYDERAVWAVFKKRSPIASACDWLAPRLGVDSPTLVNAYSRIYGRKYQEFCKRFPSFCS
jgi:hypothetical protein